MAGPLRSWAFRPSAGPSRDARADARFADELASALRSAPAGAGRLRWTIETGPRADARLEGSGHLAEWVPRCLLSRYPTGCWREVVAPSLAYPYHRPLRAFPGTEGPFRSAVDGPIPWIEPLLEIASAIPEGLELAFELVRLPPTGGAHRPGATLRPRPDGFQLDPLAHPEREIGDRAAARRIAGCWYLSGGLGGHDPGRLAGEGAARLDEILRSASRREGGGGFALTRPGRLRWPGARGFIVTDAEVAVILPRPESRFRSFGGERPCGAEPLMLGRGPDGRAVRIWLEPHQGRHLVAVGETGMGKSTALVRLAVQASRTAGVLLLDPIGDTGRRFLSELPDRAADRVLWISPTESPVALNALAPPRYGPPDGPIDAERNLDDLVTALRSVRAHRYGDVPFWGPRIEETARRALRWAARLPEGTMIDAERLLRGAGRSPRGVPPELLTEFEEIHRTATERPEEVDGARRLLSEVVENPVLRRMLCEPHPASAISEWIAPGRVSVVTGEAPRVGEGAARYLLAVLLALAWPALSAQAPAAKTVVVVDEAQWLAHRTAAEIFRLGRRANVHLWIATQALDSLPEEVAEAARTNAADLLMFRGSPTELRDVARWAPSITETGLLSLHRGEGVLLSGKGAAVQWVEIPPDPLPERADDRLDHARDRSRPAWPARPAPEAPALGEAPVDPEVARVLDVLCSGAESRAPSGEFEVTLSALRAVLDPAGTVLRRVGSLLSRAGALGDSRSGPAGTVWRIRVDRLRSLRGPANASTPGAECREQWQRVTALEGDSV